MKNKRLPFSAILLALSLSISVSGSVKSEDLAAQFVPWLYLNLLSDAATKNVTITGTVTIPNHSPFGHLWLLLDGLDGNIYGAAASSGDGRFSIEARIPRKTSDVLVYAFDPKNPEAYVKAYVNLDEEYLIGLSGQSLDAAPIAVPRGEPIPSAGIIRDLNSQAFAESFVTDATGRYRDQFTEEDWTAVNELKDGYAPNLCSSAASEDYHDLFVDMALSSRGAAIREHFDTYVRQEDPLLVRLQQATQTIIDRLVSSNQWSSLMTWHVPWVGPSLGVIRTRTALSRLNLSSMRGDDSLSGQVSRDDIEASAAMIFKPESQRNAYGNCNEKGLLGAYLASRFPEFKQVAFVAMLTDLYNQTPFSAPVPHAFALACTGDESVYDIAALYTENPANPDLPLLPPPAFYSANCYLIDPWGEIVKKLTEADVLAQHWYGVEHIMKVDLAIPDVIPSPQSNLTASSFVASPDSTSAPDLVTSLDAEVCPNNTDPDIAVCGSCPTNADLATTVCAPFDIPASYLNSGDYVVTVTASDSSAREDDDTGAFTLSRTGDLSKELNIAYTMSGTATPAIDYTFNSAATFEIGSSTFSVVVTPVKDSENEGGETVTLTISESGDYFVGSPGSADVVISDPVLHVCEDPSVPYTHYETRCANFWGCDSSVRFLKDNVICLNNAYEVITGGSLDRYSCAQEGFEECSVVNSEDISSRVDRADGSYTIYWNGGSTWMNVAPLD